MWSTFRLVFINEQTEEKRAAYSLFLKLVFAFKNRTNFQIIIRTILVTFKIVSVFFCCIFVKFIILPLTESVIF